MKRFVAAVLGLCTVLALQGRMMQAAAQLIERSKDSALVIDNVVPLRPAKVVMNMNRDSLAGKMPTGFYSYCVTLSLRDALSLGHSLQAAILGGR